MNITLTIMVGLPGSGKSHFARSLASQDERTVLLHSDSYRHTLYGSEEIQGDPNEIFKMIRMDAIAHLIAGRNVVLDATNLSYKHRVQMIDFVKANAFGDISFKAVVMATEFSICEERNASRSRHVPSHVLKRMRESFTCPGYNEGFDEICFVYTFDGANYVVGDLLMTMRDFNQETRHHTHSLLEHTQKVVSRVGGETGSEDFTMYMACLLHDCGKIYTKTFKNSKGEPSVDAHYYGHESVGAYEAMFYYATEVGVTPRLSDVQDLMVSSPTTSGEISRLCSLIQYHMRPYGFQSEKAVEKFRRLVGEDMFGDIMIINSADRDAH